MSDNLNNIDKFYKDNLQDLETETSHNLWGKLSRMLLWRKFGLWVGLTLILASALVVSTLYLPDEQSNSNSDIAAENYTSDIKSITEKPIENISNTIVTKNEKSTTAIIKDDEVSETPFLNTTNVNSEFDNVSNFSNQNIYTLSKEENELTFYDIPNYNNENNSFGLLTVIACKPDRELIIDFNKFTINTIDIRNETLHENTLPDPDYSKSQNNASWSLDIFLSPGFVTKSLRADPIYDDYLKIREDGENDIFILGLGTEIKYEIKKFYLQTGLNYSFYGENAQYNFTTNTVDPHQSYYDIDTTWIWYYDPPEYGEPHPVAFDSTYIPVYEKVIMPAKIKNRYHYLEIPLLIGFQTNKNKVNFEIGTGVSFGFLVSANGKLPDLDNNSLLEINKNSDFLRNTSFNYILRAGIQYNINSSLSLIAKPYFKRNLYSIFKADYPVKQKFTTFGVNIGIRIKL